MPDNVFDLPPSLVLTDQYPQLERLQVSVERGRDQQLQCSKILPTVLAHFDQSLGHIKEFIVCDIEAPGLLLAMKGGRLSDLMLLGAPKGVIPANQLVTMMPSVKCYEIQKCVVCHCFAFALICCTGMNGLRAATIKHRCKLYPSSHLLVHGYLKG